MRSRARGHRGVEPAREAREKRAVEDVARAERAGGVDGMARHVDRLAVRVRSAAVGSLRHDGQLRTPAVVPCSRRRVERDVVERQAGDLVPAVHREMQAIVPAERRVAHVVDVHPVSAGKRVEGDLERLRRGRDDRASAVADEDRALGHPARHRNRLDVVEIFVGDADEPHVDAESRDRAGSRRGRPSACDDASRGDDSVVWPRMTRDHVDGVARREPDADDQETFTVTSSCGRYGTTIESPSTSSASPSSSSALVRHAAATGTASRTRAVPRPPCAS